MAIRLRSTLKQWFKRGKYPLEEQFADWIDSFLHKTEDKVPLANVAGLPEQLNAKYDQASGAALEAKVETIHKKDAAQDKEITILHTTDNDQQAEIDTATVNLEHLRKCLHPTAVFGSLESTFSTLGSNYNTLWGVGNTLKTFLEAKDTANKTINCWQEIERFLQGITDSDSLTALLSSLEEKITGEYGKAIRLAAENTLAQAKDYTDEKTGEIGRMLDDINGEV